MASAMMLYREYAKKASRLKPLPTRARAQNASTFAVRFAGNGFSHDALSRLCEKNIAAEAASCEGTRAKRRDIAPRLVGNGFSHDAVRDCAKKTSRLKPLPARARARKGATSLFAS